MKLIALSLIFSFSTLAQSTSFDITCVDEGLIYKNSFSFQGEIEGALNEQANKELWELSTDELTIQTRRAGNNAQTLTTELSSLVGEATFVDSDFTKDPYYNIKMLSNDKKVFVNINANYPSKFSSSIRTVDGTVYFSTCTLKN